MKLIIGLGNPESKYNGTRHNIGFEVVDKLAEQFNAGFSSGKGNYLFAKFMYRNDPVIVIKPMTYMNLSGHAVVAAMNFYKISILDVLVVCDDLNLPIGSIRLRAKGSAGGQNGLKHIIECLGRDDFARMRIGIGKEHLLQSHSSFVLGKFTEEERGSVEKILTVSVDAILDFSASGINHAMCNYNKIAV
jgi:PTH1 family peptidyl-tRNA hydrolase